MGEIKIERLSVRDGKTIIIVTKENNCFGNKYHVVGFQALNAHVLTNKDSPTVISPPQVFRELDIEKQQTA